jgi:histidine triad (HIT) family protein
MDMRNKCIFCQIIDKKVPAKLVFQDDEVTAFWDTIGYPPIHVLVVPNLHVESLNDINPQMEPTLLKMMLVARKIAQDLGIGKDYRVFINTGIGGGQSVFHLHLHLVGGGHLNRPY